MDVSPIRYFPVPQQTSSNSSNKRTSVPSKQQAAHPLPTTSLSTASSHSHHPSSAKFMHLPYTSARQIASYEEHYRFEIEEQLYQQLGIDTYV